MSAPAIDPSAKIGEGTRLGAFCVVGPNVRVGAGCQIANHVVIHADTVIGDDVRIDDHAVIGKAPLRAANSATTKEQTLPPALLAAGCMIGAGAIVYRGAKLAEKVLVADLAAVRENATVGEKTIVGWNAYVEPDCTVGSFVKIESSAYVTAYSKIGDHCFIAPGVVTSNDNFVGRTEERKKHYKGVTVETGGRIGAGAVILPGKVIGADALVAAGSVVTKDVPGGQVVAGVPARKLRAVPEAQLLGANLKK